MPKKHEVNYSTQHSPTLARFHASNTRRRGVMGPIGSGKSTAMCMEIMRRAHEQEPGPDGIRRTRWAIVRNSYRELKDTTLKTWLDWFPEAIFGEFSTSDMAHRIKLGKVELEVLFRALDRPQDIAKVLSLEITGAWVNEARELPFGLIEALDDRSGRFPAIRDGGCTWTGLLMDTNPPDDDHWWYRLAEEDRPEGWEFFRQPGGMTEEGGQFVVNPAAENLPNLAPEFYQTRAQGKQAPYVRVYYCGRYGFLSDSKPVYPEYGDDVHCTPGDIEPIKDSVLYVGIDFGLTPAALFAQRSSMGRWIWIDELVTEDMGATKFAELLGQKLREDYPGYEARIVGDPAGMQRSQVDERTPFAVLQAHGINAVPCETNDWIIRRDALARPMLRLIEGKPGFLISPKCKTARKGLAGGYCLRRLQVVGSERYVDKPEKNKYSHVVEAGQYAMVGGGEGYAVVGLDVEDDSFDWYEQQDADRHHISGY